LDRLRLEFRCVDRIVVIGAGVGGLTAAALLAKAGLDVTVLESHIYPGGCAGTFFHKGYRFDAGATVAAGFYEGGPMDRLGQVLGIAWPADAAEIAMVVHLPGLDPIPLPANRGEWRAVRTRAFGTETGPFWDWQERTAEIVWDLALRLPPWPPSSASDIASVARLSLPIAGRQPGSIPGLLLDALRPLASRLTGAPPSLRLFADAQSLISAQTTSDRAGALYAAGALDLPRRGVVQLRGGMGAIATALVDGLQRHGGRIRYRSHVTAIVTEGDRPVAVETARGESFPAEVVVANLTPWDAAGLMRGDPRAAARSKEALPKDGWGAFVLYLGLDEAAVPDGLTLHHQVVRREPLGEGNSIFLSLSPSWDDSRAPRGKRAITISTHTALEPWWSLFERDRTAYEAKRDLYAARLLEAAATALPALPGRAEQVMPGTPITFQRFTHRTRGWVGGFPQTGLLRARSSRLSPGVWMVGDSIFPGQSTASVAIGGMRVAADIVGSLHRVRR
jgi:C-3',4' desaturase CrtD